MPYIYVHHVTRTVTIIFNYSNSTGNISIRSILAYCNVHCTCIFEDQVHKFYNLLAVLYREINGGLKNKDYLMKYLNLCETCKIISFTCNEYYNTVLHVIQYAHTSGYVIHGF